MKVKHSRIYFKKPKSVTTSKPRIWNRLCVFNLETARINRPGSIPPQKPPPPAPNLFYLLLRRSPSLVQLQHLDFPLLLTFSLDFDLSAILLDGGRFSEAIPLLSIEEAGLCLRRIDRCFRLDSLVLFSFFLLLLHAGLALSLPRP